nr:hypothetical protein Iba_chr13dCG10200 [Ipomoea batatas]
MGGAGIRRWFVGLTPSPSHQGRRSPAEKGGEEESLATPIQSNQIIPNASSAHRFADADAVLRPPLTPPPARRQRHRLLPRRPGPTEGLHCITHADGGWPLERIGCSCMYTLTG